jgi:hypothetical protein
MKYLFLVLFILTSFYLQAQSPFLVNNFTLNGQTYICKTSTRNITSIYNQNNLSTNRESESHPYNNCNMARLDYSKVRQVLRSIFSQTQRIQFKNNNTRLNITFFIAPTTGETLELRFAVGKNTPFTQNDIYLLEQGLKGQIMQAKPFCAPMTYIVFPLTVYWEVD